jgi:hypothetical protein
MEMKLKYPQIYEFYMAEDTPALLKKIHQSKQSLRYKLSSWEKLKFPIEFFTYQGFLRPLKDSEGNWYKNVSDAAEALEVRYYDIAKARDEEGIISLDKIQKIQNKRRRRSENACI